MILNAIAWLSMVMTLSKAGTPNQQVVRMAKPFYWSTLPDKITHLPGVTEMPTFSMFSGYLEISPRKALFYWLNECEDPASKKLIVWFNGGPGCSSMDGLFDEHGPYKFNSVNGQLVKNSYSWNKLAHTLYIDSPAGVGFSYDTEPSDETNDDLVALDSLQALKKFFVKFPRYQTHDLYIAGESYAGVYVPTLVNAIVADNSWMVPNIKGIVIGNGLLNEDINTQSLVYFAYYHGLLGTTLWNELRRYCCDKGKCNFNPSYNEDCQLKTYKVSHITQDEGLNFYNLYATCATESQNELRKNYNGARHLFPAKQFQAFRSKDDILGSSKLTLVPSCTNATFITNYLNRLEVQEALHVHVKEWQLCNETVLTSYVKLYPDMTQPIKKILASLDNIHVLLYFGDVDMACNHLGGEWFVDQLNYEIMTPRRYWFIPADDGSMQVGGFYKEYDRLTYAIVKGAGHMVPADKPKEAFVMLQHYLNREPL